MSTNSEWPEGATPPATPLPVAAEASPHSSQENPPWSGWDVLRIGLLLFVLPFIVLPVVGIFVQKAFYRGTSIGVVLQKPWLALSTQFVLYLLVLAYMI